MSTRALALAHELRDRIRRCTELTVTIAVGEPVTDAAKAAISAQCIADRKLLLGSGDGDRVIAGGGSEGVPCSPGGWVDAACGGREAVSRGPVGRVDAACGGSEAVRGNRIGRVDAACGGREAVPRGPVGRVDAALAACIRRGDRRGAVEVLTRWVDRCAAQPGMTPEVLRHWLIAALLGATEAAGARRLADGSVDWAGVPLTDMFEVAEIHERSYLRLWLEGLMSRLIAGRSNPGDPLELAIAHINQHFDDPDLRLETVAAAISVSPYYISHLFRRQRGETFLRYLTGCRLAHARALLTRTTLPVEQIAGRSGYASAKRFRIVFKRHLGCPPAEYRRRSLLR
ncbi:MAG TPA: helix-turn-helix transcriptional regulator [Candidatus Limnocylindrales bacterium]